MRRHPWIRNGWLLLVLATFALAPRPVVGGEPTVPDVIGEGTPWATPVHDLRGKADGPTILLVGGVHGDEPAGALAAEQIRHWPLRAGRLVIVPRANVSALAAGRRRTPGVAKELGDLNRNFPRAGREEGPRGERSTALWKLAVELQPDWVVDLHEGSDFRIRNPKSVGSTVIHTYGARTRVAAELMVRAVNTIIQGPTWHWVPLRQPINGSLARAAHEHLGARSFIVETTTKGQARSRRVRQHRHAVHRLLVHLGMLSPETPPDGVRATEGSKILVGLYDSLGASGPGVPKLTRQLAEAEGIEAVRIGPEEVRSGGIFACDVLLFPGGLGSKQGRNIDAAGRERVRAFIDGGGGYVGICAGAYLALDGYTWGLKVVRAKTLSSRWARGRGKLDVELTDKGREIFGELEAPVKILYHNGPVIGPSETKSIPGMEPLAYFREEVAANGTPKGIMKDSPAIFGGAFGDGRVIAFSPHPEQTKGREAMVLDAIRWVARRADRADATSRLRKDAQDALGDAAVFEVWGEVGAKRETLDRWFRLGTPAAWRAIRDAVLRMADELQQRHEARLERWAQIEPGLSAPMPHTTAHAEPLIEIMNAQDGETRYALELLVTDTAWRLAQQDAGAWRPLLHRAGGAAANPYARVVAARLAGWLFGRPAGAAPRAAVAMALRRTLDPKRERDTRVRVAAYDALNERPEGPSELVHQGLVDPSWDVRVRATHIVTAHRMRETVPMLIGNLERASRRERAAIGKALAVLTGHKAEPDPVTWQRWLDADRPEAGPGSAPSDTPRSTFYGIDVESERVLFLLDLSTSMKEPVEGAKEGETSASRIEVARAELAQALRLLPSDATFGVIAFNTAVRSWQPTLQPATPDNREAALAWLAELGTEGNTCLWGALRTALRQARRAPHEGVEPPVDTLVVLTDGEPTWYGVDDPGMQSSHQLRHWVRQWNPHGIVRIHAVAPKGAPGAGLMRALASDNHGNFAVR
ncbi:MAG: succinylglutamate desuccinylase/aspartoacylase family protein [Planctomycetota bacterium]|nr:succinylglutamate desuccinylase/aspartoacylase family protein [Planctomycetota bacterium]